jgi:hypothetical protein
MTFQYESILANLATDFPSSVHKSFRRVCLEMNQFTLPKANSPQLKYQYTRFTRNHKWLLDFLGDYQEQEEMNEVFEACLTILMKISKRMKKSSFSKPDTANVLAPVSSFANRLHTSYESLPSLSTVLDTSTLCPAPPAEDPLTHDMLAQALDMGCTKELDIDAMVAGDGLYVSLDTSSMF